MRNVEIKAHLRDPAAVRRGLRSLRPGPAKTLRQEDVYFEVPAGRLKLRLEGPRRGELIAYERPGRTGPKLCRYAIFKTRRPAELRRVLAAALAVRGIVRKTRRLALVGRTRVHLDDVSGLGRFLELEVVLEPGETAASGRAEARRIMAALGLRPADLVEKSYIDLLERAARLGRGKRRRPSGAGRA